MLMPSKVKYRKQQRGRMRGTAYKGSELSFGEYGLQALEPGWLTARQIEAARVAVQRHVKRGGKLWIRVFPDKPITKKPAETRMGKGKGAPEGWVCVIKPARLLVDAFHLEENAGGLDHAHPALGSALALAHSGFSGFLRDRLVGKHADPQLSAALHVALDRDAGRLD